MSKPEKGPTSPSRRGKDEPDGVVLFDPTPRPAAERLAPLGRPRHRLARSLLGILLITVIGVGGYQLYQRRASSAQEPEVPVIVEPVGGPTAGGSLALSPFGRDVLEGRAGSSLRLEVRALGPGSLPVVDSLVRFEVVSGGGVVDPDTTRTDRQGIARASLTLPSRAGPVVVLAHLGETEQQTRLVVNARAGPPARVVASEGNGQGAEVGELLPSRITVIVYDEVGVPVPGADVRFSVVTGSGVVAPSRARTDSLGVATALWRLGNSAGTQQLSATAGGTDQPAMFSANARGRPVASDGNPLPIEAGPVTVEARPFVIGGSHVCVLVATTARCRGADDLGQLGTGGTSGFVALASGISHTCGLRARGEAVCWGANEGGQLGDGSREFKRSPVPVRAELRFSSLTAGAAHTCGLAGGGVPVCWGQNLNGQLGDGSRTDARFPRIVGGGVSFRTLVAGWNHTCGLTANGNAFCWGLNSDGQLGDGSRLDRLVPVPVRGSTESLTAGSAHTCGVSDGQVFCWGDNRAGQLGDGTTVGRVQPTQVPGLSSVRQVVAGAVHTCALDTDGRAYCWGQNPHGQLGDGSTTNRNTPVAVEGGLRFQSIHAGGAMTCGTVAEGEEYCWGLNQSGQLGDGTRESRARPTPVQR